MRATIESSLLAEIQARIARISEAQHELARQKRILMDAATQLRLGRPACTVIAEIEEQSPSLAPGDGPGEPAAVPRRSWPPDRVAAGV